jgi:(2Fe-2S) ferredoxin
MRHSVHDGKGIRDVYLDGVWLERVVWADTKRARVVCLRYPFVVRNGCLARCFHQGKVLEVVFRG